MKHYKWWIYTVIIGLLPFLIRGFIFYITDKVDSQYVLNEIDLVAFGLVLSTTNINELESELRFSDDWKGLIRGITVVLLILMAGILTATYIIDATGINLFDRRKIKIVAMLLNIMAFLLSLGIIYRPVSQQDGG